MKLQRRKFLKFVAGSLGAALVSAPKSAEATEEAAVSPDTDGCLVDLTLCVGCRLCEQACNEINQLPNPEVPFDDLTVTAEPRRPTQDAFTVVNSYVVGAGSDPADGGASYAKVQCMHCNRPGCVSACIVGALVKTDSGAVIYDASKCIGCRYCMVACPHGIPAYEYHDPLTPRVRKCTFCYERISEGKPPACAAICPMEAIRFGKRDKLLELAHRKVANPSRSHRNSVPIVNHVYGEHEVGGSSWLYLSAVPFEKLGFTPLPAEAAPDLTETIQHGIFKHFVPPAALFGLLGLAMHLFKGRSGDTKTGEAGK